MKRRILAVIDMQNDFLSGALKNEEAMKIVSKVKKKIEEWDGEVIFTRDTHHENYFETQEGKNLPIKHCIENTSGWEISKELNCAQVCKIFDKNTFGSIELAKWLKEREAQIEEIQFVGVCTDICVISNAMLAKAFVPECLISVDAQCCAGVTVQNHINALNAMESCQIKILR